jgi:hypothetical protein
LAHYGDGAAFQLTCEAKRIDLAFLFDPMMAVHTSNVDAIPSSKPSGFSIHPDRKAVLSAAARTRTPANGIRVNSIHVELPGYRKNY